MMRLRTVMLAVLLVPVLSRRSTRAIRSTLAGERATAELQATEVLSRKKQATSKLQVHATSKVQGHAMLSYSGLFHILAIGVVYTILALLYCMQKETAVEEHEQHEESKVQDLCEAFKQANGPANTAKAFADARSWLRTEGVKALTDHLQSKGFVDDAGFLRTNGTPFNLFAQIAAGTIMQEGMGKEQQALGDFAERFMIACNKEDCDKNWGNEATEWVGKASMSKQHRFLTTRDLHWQWFNVLTMGFVEDTSGSSITLESIEVAIAEVRSLKDAALQYTREIGAITGCSWEGPIGLYFHVWPHNSVNSLHLHIVDLASKGPTFHALQYKNLNIDDVLEVLEEERNALATS